jgi:hypothetical protein
VKQHTGATRPTGSVGGRLGGLLGHDAQVPLGARRPRRISQQHTHGLGRAAQRLCQVGLGGLGRTAGQGLGHGLGQRRVRGRTAHQDQAVAGVERGAPEGDARVLVEPERAAQAGAAALAGERAVADGEGGGVTDQGDVGGAAAGSGDGGGGGDVGGGQHIAVVVAQDVVGGQGGLADGAGLRAGLGADKGLLHGAQDAALEVGVDAARVDEQEQAQGAGAEGPEGELAGNDSAEGSGAGERAECWGRMSEGEVRHTRRSRREVEPATPGGASSAHAVST